MLCVSQVRAGRCGAARQAAVHGCARGVRGAGRGAAGAERRGAGGRARLLRAGARAARRRRALAALPASAAGPGMPLLYTLSSLTIFAIKFY